MAAEAHPYWNSNSYLWTPQDEVKARVWRVTESTDAETAIGTVGVSYHDAHPDNADLYADEARARLVPGAADVMEVTIVYRARTRATRRAVGESEDRYISRETSIRLQFSLLPDAPTIPLGPLGVEGIDVRRGDFTWIHTEWLAASDIVAVKAIGLFTRNVAEFHGYPPGELLLVGYDSVELGENYWQSQYVIDFDPVGLHQLFFRYTDAITGFGDLNNATIHERVSWATLF